MARRKRPVEPLPAIWRTDDVWWEKIEAVLATFDPPASFGPERIDPRKALDGVIYRMCSGVQWNHLPPEFGDDASVHRTFQRWVKRGVIAKLWALLVETCDELGGVDWRWQSFEGALEMARHGGIKLDRTQPTGRSLGRSAAC